jgi:DNA-binding XRE family transcriptional regulator
MPDKIKVEIGCRIRELRKNAGLSQAALAAHIPGVSQQSIHQLEQGAIARPRYLPELAELFRVDERWLRTGKGHSRPQGRPAATRALDRRVLTVVLTVVDRKLTQSKLRHDCEFKAELIATMYSRMVGAPNLTQPMLEAAVSEIILYEQARWQSAKPAFAATGRVKGKRRTR